MGDLHVSRRVINQVFADHFLMQDTMDQLVQDAGNPVHQDVNTIPGYSGFWIMGQADYYRYFGDHAYLRSNHDALVQLLSYMETELDEPDLFANARKAWPFIEDWSPDLNGDTPEVRRTAHLEFYKAFLDGAWLLQEQGDAALAEKFRRRADAMKAAARKYLVESSTQTFGLRRQTSAMAIFSEIADATETEVIWKYVLSRPTQFMISPYYNYYAISAMARAGHPQNALDEIRNYWDGMIKEGATSTWEAYDPGSPKEDFHQWFQSTLAKATWSASRMDGRLERLQG
jgi:alpha-L-rhamnosidase